MSSAPVLQTTSALPRQNVIARALRAPEAALAGLIVVMIVMFSLINPAFFSIDTAQTVLRAVSSVGLIVIGMSLLLVSGKFDLSVGSVAALAAVVAGQAMTTGVPSPAAVLLGITAAALVGALNAWLALWVRIPVLIVTLGTLYIARGIALVITDGRPVSDLPAEFVAFAKIDIAGLPLPAWIFLALVVVAQFLLQGTAFGRSLYAAGGGEAAAHLAGVRVRLVQTISFITVSVLAGVAGVLIMSRIAVGQPSIGEGYELNVLASCVVGGVSLFGGRGSIVGAFLGVIFVQVLSVGMVLAQLNPTLQQVGIGAALLAAITIDVVRSRTGSRRH